MCIIAFKPEAAAPLGKEVLESCWDSNDDGAGFVYWDDDENTWHIKKGFLSFIDFWTAYSDMNFTNEDIVACHFRIGTSGNNDGGNCHPFPITDNYDMMRETDLLTDKVLIHNGVIGKGEGIYSDTMKHIKDVVHPLLPLWNSMESLSAVFDKVMEVHKCRWIIMCPKPDGSGSMYSLHGTWVDSPEHPGVKFSNGTYKSYKSSYTYPATGTCTNSYANPNWQRRANDKMLAEKSSTPAAVDAQGNIKDYSGGGFNSPNLHTVTYHKVTGDLLFVGGALDLEEVSPNSLICPACKDGDNYLETSYLSSKIVDFPGSCLCFECNCVFSKSTGMIHTYLTTEEMRIIEDETVRGASSTMLTELTQIDTGLWARPDGTLVDSDEVTHNPDDYDFTPSQLNKWNDVVNGEDL